MRQVVLDTETTGLEDEDRIIEIGCVELLNREINREFHCLLNPERAITAGAQKVHGRSDRDLQDKPRFSEVADRFLEFIDRAEVVIHNAPFDLGFLDRELSYSGRGENFIRHCGKVIDTLEMARNLFPGRRHSLDAMCDFYRIDRSAREMHDALLDARLLAQVYLRMTGGQTRMELAERSVRRSAWTASSAGPQTMKIIRASEEELQRHRQMLRNIRDQAEDGACLWLEMEEKEEREGKEE